jgi:hypothetical protein
MRSFAAFLLGIIVGVAGTLYLPFVTLHREQMNTDLRKELDVLQAQMHDIGDKLKTMNLPKPQIGESASPSPSPTVSPP